MAMPSTIYGKHAATGMAAVARLPDEVSITITRSGAEPARITVKNKEQSWELTEKELDKLPADIRNHVEPLLSPRGTGTSSTNRALTAWSARMPIQSEASGKAGSSDTARQLQERQDAMLKQLQQLTEKVEKLQQALEKSAPKP
jgi:hypothetical protein